MPKSKGFYGFDVLVPKKEYDYKKWAVIACDQYTSDVSYWDGVAEAVGDAPSTLKMIVPEAYLNGNDVENRIKRANETMKEYLDNEIFEEHKSSMVYVERQQSNGQLRRGIVGTIDLEDYEFKNGEECLVRPTEDVVMSRIPPRLKVRENALLETSHVLLMIADRENKVIGSIEKAVHDKNNADMLYDFELQPNGGNISGYLLQGDTVESVQENLASLVKDNLMFLVGDGNHSVATAKEFYEKNRDNSLARFAMVEIINMFDESLIFEPIHRIMYNVDTERLIDALIEYYPGAVKSEAAGCKPAAHETESQMVECQKTVEHKKNGHEIELCCADGTYTVTIPYKYNYLAVGALQQFLDDYISKNKCEIDYIHDENDVRTWSQKSGTVGFVLPKIDIDGLVDYVKEKGRLPRKTFSIGNQEDKKYYLECRKIR